MRHFTYWFVLVAMLPSLASCGRRLPMSVRMMESEMRRCPEAVNLDGMGGRLKWNYTTGLELLSFLDAACSRGPSAKSKGLVRAPQGEPGTSIAFPMANAGTLQERVIQYTDRWYDAIIREDGSIGANYRLSNYNLDHICPARTLFGLQELCPREKYAKAIEAAAAQLRTQPRTNAGAFWHKSIYPNQVWLDGLYMAEPFYAQYACMQPAEVRDSLLADASLQFRVAYDHCFDPATGLLRHAWDESGQMFWADPVTGQSAHSWGRAMGWYVMALVEVLDFFPENHPDRAQLLDILTYLLGKLPEYADPATGMWYQVLDCPGREGNYVEATCSAMFTYSYLKAVSRGWLGREWAKYSKDCYRKLVKTFIREDADGTITLTRCCAVAGLGGKENRSGSYEYYINERITENDPKGVGPFIWASLIIENKGI